MNDPRYEQLRDASWRRKLTPAERAELDTWLAGHPESAPDWAADATLTEALRRMPDAPVPSNFTARVLDAVDRDEREPAPARQGWYRRWHALIPKAAVAVLALSIGFFAYQQHEAEKRAAFTRNLETLSAVASITDPEVLRDFETVRLLGQAPPADQDLLALLK